MEFNVNATDAGARLREGAGNHTLSIGDHNVTLMINGDRVALQRFALAVAIAAKLKVRVDGHIDGNAAYQEVVAALDGDEDILKFSLGNALKQLSAQRVQHDTAIEHGDNARRQTVRLIEKLAEVEAAAKSTQDLAEKIAEKVRQMDITATLGREGLTLHFVSANADGSTTGEWRASVPSIRIGDSRHRRTNAYGATPDAAIAALAQKLGVL